MTSKRKLVRKIRLKERVLTEKGEFNPTWKEYKKAYIKENTKKGAPNAKTKR